MKSLHVVLTLDTPLYQGFNSLKKAYYDAVGDDVVFVYNGIDESLNRPDKGMYNFHSDHNGNGIPVMLQKFLYMLEQPIVDDYDLIIRENASTFLNMPVIREFGFKS